MAIDTAKFIDDAVQNLVSILNSEKATWGVKEVFPWQAVMRSIYPCIEVNATGATGARIESGGGYMWDISLEVWFWFHQVNEKLRKEELDQRTSEIATFIASHPSLDGYASDVVVDSVSITALPEQPESREWVAVSVIACRVRKEAFLTYE